MKGIVKEIGEELLDAVFPRSLYCICCGKIIDKSRTYSLCDHCIKTIRWNVGKTCAKCGKQLLESDGEEYCNNCRSKGHFFDKGFACCQYGLYERTIIFDFKYRGRTYIGKEIASSIGDRLNQQNVQFDYIVPVPISKKRYKTRGFNQAAIMGSHLAKSMNSKLINPLERVKNTTAQRGLDAYGREENLKSAFRVKKQYEKIIEGKDILLIDDIYTTGATADSCTLELRKAGAQKVYVGVFAISGNKEIKY